MADANVDHSGMPEDDPDISDDETIYRWLSRQANFVVRDSETKELRVSSGAFAPDSDGLSVYRHELLKRDGHTPITGLVLAEENVIISLNLGEVRSLKLGLIDDPNPPGVRDPDHPRHRAHALVIGWRGISKKERMRRQKELTKLPSVRFIHG